MKGCESTKPYNKKTHYREYYKAVVNSLNKKDIVQYFQSFFALLRYLE